MASLQSTQKMPLYNFKRRGDTLFLSTTSTVNVLSRWPIIVLASFSCFCAVASPSLNEIVFQDVQAAHHLGEDKHPVATSLQLWQQLVNQHQLASSLDHCLELKIWRLCIVRFFKLFQNFLFSTCRDWTAWREYREGVLLLKTMDLLSKPTTNWQNQNGPFTFKSRKPPASLKVRPRHNYRFTNGTRVLGSIYWEAFGERDPHFSTTKCLLSMLKNNTEQKQTTKTCPRFNNGPLGQKW